MGLFRRERRSVQDEGMTPFRAGVVALVVLVVATYFGFSKANPFSSAYELKAAFETASNVQPRSPVRIAGVEVGKVTKVEPLTGDGNGAAVVTMEIEEKGLPIHEDARLKIRPRIFLEGNFFVELEPGSPSAPILEDGERTIATTQTAAPVQFGDLLAALQSDTRADLQTLLQEYSQGLAGGGAEGFNRSIKYWKDAYRSSAIAQDATLGENPAKDIQRVLRGQGELAAALVTDERALKDLVTNFDVTAAALAREDSALAASIPALRDVLRVGRPALGSLNDALPSLRAFAREALPGVRSSGPTLDASVPFMRQLRGLVSKPELRSAAAELRRRLPALVRLNSTAVPLLEQARALSACTNKVLVPFVQSRIPDVAGEPGNSDQQVRHQIQRSFVGLSGESRIYDANSPFFHTSGVPNPTSVQPAPPPVVDQPPPRRPDVPCETQDPPNLAAPGGPSATFSSSAQTQTSFDAKALMRAGELMKRYERRRGGR
jgi:virulence factor Mce-like protein